jgi:choline dehydrogenase-like flavoprotein
LAQAWYDGLKELGYSSSANLYDELSLGGRAYTATIDLATSHRSSADTGYGVPARKRPNIMVITDAPVQKMLFSGIAPNARVTSIEVIIKGEHSTVNIGADQEVILSAGAYHTPKLLELSGIGNKDHLKSLGISLVMDNPAVGENLQNHVMAILPYQRMEHIQLPPGIQAVAFLRLPKVLENDILDRYLPESDDRDYQHAIRDLILSPGEASSCIFTSLGPANLVLLGVIPSIPFSRGSSHVSSANPDQNPTIDPKLLSHPLDLELMAHHLLAVEQLALTGPLSKLLKPAAPGIGDLEAAKQYLQNAALATHHPCGTAALLPKDHGGVVGEDLIVYGTQNLRVVDASIIPIIPHANPLTTVYAVAEKAADIIKGSKLG